MMKRVLLMLAISPLLSFSGVKVAKAATVECPAHAPALWGLGPDANLSAVNVLSAPAGEAIDEAAPPALTPNLEKIAKGISHVIWKVNTDGPGWTFYVDCHYQNSDRLIRLQIAGKTLCDYTTEVASHQGGKHSLVCR